MFRYSLHQHIFDTQNVESHLCDPCDQVFVIGVVLCAGGPLDCIFVWVNLNERIHCLRCRLQYFPLSLIAGILGVVTDILMITIIAVCKSPYMLVKGWHRLFHDCIGREGPFLETICVPFAGLAILLWPFTVAVAVLGSVMSSVFLGAYAAVIVYQVEYHLL